MIGNDWDDVLSDIYNKDYFKILIDKVNKEYEDKIIFPSKDDLFNAFKLTSFNDVKVVIVGQDPYHGEGEAHGLSFSVRDGIKIPPSLKNIYKELYDDLGVPIRDSGNLDSWARQGVLLLNSTLTVEKDKPNSHSKIGWQEFTDEVIKIIDKNKSDVVFLLWGNYARSKKELIKNNYIIESSHPSPFSARNGFFGSRPFSKTNDYLMKMGIKEINWQQTKSLIICYNQVVSEERELRPWS